MSIERLDISRQLAPDMRQHLDEAAMIHLLRCCGGVIIGDGEEWHIKIGGQRRSNPSRVRVLNQALDLIAARQDLWPLPPSAA